MKNFIKAAILLFGIFVACKTTVKTAEVSGMVKARRHSIMYWKDSINDVTDYYNDVWVKDSFLIFKCNQVRSIDNTDTARKRAILETRNYSFINLRNYNCQDYLEFNDAASPISNYTVGLNDTSLNYLFQIGHYPSRNNKPPKFSKISDTIENGEKYKRFQSFKTYADNFVVRTVVFVSSKKYPLYFQAGREWGKLLNLRDDAVITKIYDFHNNHIEQIALTENLSNQLTPYDEKVFEKWKENNIHSTLPLITGTEASKVLNDTLFKLYIKKVERFQ